MDLHERSGRFRRTVHYLVDRPQAQVNSACRPCSSNRLELLFLPSLLRHRPCHNTPSSIRLSFISPIYSIRHHTL